MNLNRRTESPHPPSAAAEPARSQGGLILHARELFRQGPVVQIRHHGETYQLRLTRQDRLILTK